MLTGHKSSFPGILLSRHICGRYSPVCTIFFSDPYQAACATIPDKGQIISVFVWIIHLLGIMSRSCLEYVFQRRV